MINWIQFTFLVISLFSGVSIACNDYQDCQPGTECTTTCGCNNGSSCSATCGVDGECNASNRAQNGFMNPGAKSADPTQTERLQSGASSTK